MFVTAERPMAFCHGIQQDSGGFSCSHLEVGVLTMLSCVGPAPPDEDRLASYGSCL